MRESSGRHCSGELPQLHRRCGHTHAALPEAGPLWSKPRKCFKSVKVQQKSVRSISHQKAICRICALWVKSRSLIFTHDLLLIFPMIFNFPIMCPWSPHDLPWSSHDFPMIFPWCSPWRLIPRSLLTWPLLLDEWRSLEWLDWHLGSCARGSCKLT